MRRRKIVKTEWLTWEGDDFPRTLHSDSVVFYITGHFDLDSDQELRKDLAVAIQREGISSSLGESFSLLNSASISLAGFYTEDSDLDLPIYCDLDDENYDWDATYVEVPYVFDTPDWHEDAECAKPENFDKIDNFFANKPAQQWEAKKLCGNCPVKRDCVKWALDNKQIWGIWGGLDSGQIRNTLSVNWDGQEMRYKRFPLCPSCRCKTDYLKTATVDRPEGGRWATMRIVRCDKCHFTWQSRTSANAVDAFHALKEKKDRP